MSPVPRWRIATGILVLLLLLLFAAALVPVYFHNFELRNFVAAETRSASHQPIADDHLRARIVAKASALNLPITDRDVQVLHTAGGLRVGVQYFVTVNLPGYTVNLHFSPWAGSR